MEILIIWGPGTAEVIPLRDKIEAILKEQAHTVHIIRDEVVLIGADPKNVPAVAKEGSFQATFQRMVDDSQLAIALIAEDNCLDTSGAPSTHRGNAWLESYYWIGVHSDHTLLTVFVQESDNTDSELTITSPPPWPPSEMGHAGSEHYRIVFDRHQTPEQRDIVITQEAGNCVDRLLSLRQGSGLDSPAEVGAND